MHSDLKPKDTIILNTWENLKHAIILPYSAVYLTKIPIKNELIYFSFNHTLLYEQRSKVAKTNSEIFGIGSLDIKQNYEVKIYPLPLGFYQENSASVWSVFRYFHFAAEVGHEFIFYLQGPVKYSKDNNLIINHFLFSFNTFENKWYRIIDIDADGNHLKSSSLPSSDNIIKFNPNSDKYAICNKLGELIIWNNNQGKLRIEIDKNPDEYFNKSQNEKDCLNEKYKNEKHYECFKYRTKDNIFFPSSNTFEEPLIIENNKFNYEISGIKDIIEQELLKFDLPNNDKVSIKYEMPFIYQKKSYGILGFFIHCFLPRKWEKSLFFVFNL